MKVKFSVIPFIPAAIAMIALRVMSIFGADANGKLFGMDKMAVAYTVIGIAMALFIVCILINIFDRKTAPVYPVKKNIAAGVLSILSGAMVISSSVGAFMNTTTDSEYYIMTLVCALFSLPAGIAFFLMSRVHFVGKSVVSGISMLFVFPALWGCSELVHEFLNATKVSISATDLSSLFCYIFITLYYFSHSMVVSRIKGRNPVKGCFIYGLPGIALLLSNSLYTYFTGVQEGTGYVSALSAVQYLVLALYAASFLIEMFRNSVTKDELEIIDGLPTPDAIKEEEDKYIKTDGYEDLVFPESGETDSAEEIKQEYPVFDEVETISDFAEPEVPATDPEPAPSDAEPVAKEAPKEQEIPSEYYQNAKGMDDFIIGYQAPMDDEPIPYFTKNEQEKVSENPFVTNYTQDTPQVESPGSGFMKKLFKKKSAPVIETKPEPVVDSKPEPVVETKPELVVDSKPEPVVETKPEPVVDSKPEPVVETKPEPVVESKPEPVSMSNPEPVPQRPVRHTPSRQRSAQQRSAQQRSAQQRPAQQRPAQQRPAQQRTAQQRPAQQRPVQQRPAQQRNVQQRPVQQRPRPSAAQGSRNDDINELLRELDSKEKRS